MDLELERLENSLLKLDNVSEEAMQIKKQLFILRNDLCIFNDGDNLRLGDKEYYACRIEQRHNDYIMTGKLAENSTERYRAYVELHTIVYF